MRLNTLIWWAILPPDAKSKSKPLGSYSIDLTDIPPIPHEEWMPPIHSLLYKVLFYYTYAGNAGRLLGHRGKALEQRSEPLRRTVECHPGSGEQPSSPPATAIWTKAKKLYKAVQALDNTDFSREKRDSPSSSSSS